MVVILAICGEVPELAEGARLEIVCPPKRRTEGSNPSLSAIFRLQMTAAGSHAAGASEPRQARKGATVRRMSWVPWGSLAAVFMGGVRLGASGALFSGGQGSS